MLESTFNKISSEEFLRSIEFYLSLSTKERQSLYPILDSSCKSALKVLSILENRWIEYEDLSLETGFSLNTVKQISYALSQYFNIEIKSPTLQEKLSGIKSSLRWIKPKK